MKYIDYLRYKKKEAGLWQRVKPFQTAQGELPYDIDIIAENLNIPWAIAIREDGTLYVTERPGTIRIIRDGQLLTQPLISMRAPFFSGGEGGLLGIALDPDFAQNHLLYIYHTYSEGLQTYNRLVRLVENNDRAEVDQVLLNRLPGGISHNGGRIKVGPDGKLYVATGDAGNPSLSQNLSNLAGKILRLNLDGSIPEDNPIAGSAVYCYGLRNPQGITWNSNGMMYASDHGATAHDEINRIIPGANYGWPTVPGDQEREGITAPMIHSEDATWAPSGITYVSRGPWQGSLAVACLLGKQLLLAALDEAGTGITGLEYWLWNEFGRLREAVQAEDGSIYLTTNNRDGRGTPREGDDKVIRLIPR